MSNLLFFSLFLSNNSLLGIWNDRHWTILAPTTLTHQTHSRNHHNFWTCHHPAIHPSIPPSASTTMAWHSNLPYSNVRHRHGHGGYKWATMGRYHGHRRPKTKRSTIHPTQMDYSFMKKAMPLALSHAMQRLMYEPSRDPTTSHQDSATYLNPLSTLVPWLITITDLFIAIDTVLASIDYDVATLFGSAFSGVLFSTVLDKLGAYAKTSSKRRGQCLMLGPWLSVIAFLFLSQMPSSEALGPAPPRSGSAAGSAAQGIALLTGAAIALSNSENGISSRDQRRLDRGERVWNKAMDQRTKRSCEEEEAAHPSELEPLPPLPQHRATHARSKGARCSTDGRTPNAIVSMEMEHPLKTAPKKPIERTNWSTDSRLVEAVKGWLDGPGNDANGKPITKGVYVKRYTTVNISPIRS